MIQKKSYFLFAVCLLGVVVAIASSALAHGVSIDLSLSPESSLAALGNIEARHHLPVQVSEYIQSVSTSGSSQELALIQLGKDYTSAVLRLENETVSVRAARNVIESEFCVRSEFGLSAYRHISKIHSLIFSSYEGARLGIRFNTFLSKALPYLPPEADWAKECRFNRTGKKS